MPVALRTAIGILCAAALGLVPNTAQADDGGLSFWLPGVFGSLAAVPGQPGWSWSTLYVHLDVSGGGGKEFQRGGAIVAGLHARSDVVASGPTYIFATPVAGGQAAFSLFGAAGGVNVGIDATLTGPRGNQISGSATDQRTTFTDVFWQGSLKWHEGVHNTMIYATGNIPSGTYDPNRLANLSLGFTAVDGGAGYTYLDTKTGNEFSVVAGLTYNFINRDLQYQNGIDFHLDWGASKFVSKDLHVGLVGYYFQQITGDSGAGARLGDFKGRVLGIGPQVGFMFPAGEGYQGYINLKGYRDFAPENRPDGFTVWATFALSPAAPEPSQPRSPRMVVK